MKIKKDFAPITMTLESEEDRNIWLNILEAAQRSRDKSRYGLFPGQPFMEKGPLVDTIAYIRRGLL